VTLSRYVRRRFSGQSDACCGTISGQIHGLLYQGNGNYLTDTGVTYTHAQLVAFVTAGDTLTIMGVVPGTGSATY